MLKRVIKRIRCIYRYFMISLYDEDTNYLFLLLLIRRKIEFMLEEIEDDPERTIHKTMIDILAKLDFIMENNQTPCYGERETIEKIFYLMNKNIRNWW